MFDSIIYLVVILVPVAIFIGRLVSGARNKNQPSAPVVVHFEENEEPEYFRGKAPALSSLMSAPLTRASIRSAPRNQEVLAASIPEESLPPAENLVSLSVADTPAPKRNVPAPAASGQGKGSLNLSHLSPLKQAVVMAEILGPPKGLE